MNKYPFKIKTVFFLISFFVLSITIFLIGVTYSILFHLDLASLHNRKLLIITLPVMGIIVGIIFSKIISKRPIKTIIEFSTAIKEVANGNFNIRLKENTPIKEFNDMSQSFNIMTQELSNMEIFRNDFINNVSHEFKTPLSAIEGYVTLLQNKSLSDDKKNLYIDKILYNTNRLSSLTGNILTLSNLENQSTYIKKESYSLDEQLRQNILLFEHEWEEKLLNLDIELDSVDYYGNSEMLSQVWQNLIGNAIKFISYGGNISITLHQHDKEINISISDDGMGMNKETQSRIFEKFYQGDTSHSSQGNGLGLNIVKRVIYLHNGSINVSSEEGKGSVFTVILPL